MDNPLISVLVPIYNGEKYIDKLISCLQNQTYRNFEVILVNDISTDNSENLINSYSQDDSRLKLINRNTKGGTAISGIVYGLPYCTGEYYFYLSQDDFIDENCLEKCIEKALEIGVDIVVPNMVFYYENKKSKKKGKYPKFGNYNSFIGQEEAFYASLKWHIGGIGLRKMDLMNRAGFKNEHYNDDEYYVRKSFLLANKVAFADTNFYYRQDNQDAITKKTHYFTFDVLTTDILLAKCLLEYKYSNRKRDKRFNELLKQYPDWVDLYRANKDKFSDKEREYVIKILNDAKNELENIVNSNNLLFSRITLFFKKLEEVKE